MADDSKNGLGFGGLNQISEALENTYQSGANNRSSSFNGIKALGSGRAGANYTRGPEPVRGTAHAVEGDVLDDNEQVGPTIHVNRAGSGYTNSNVLGGSASRGSIASSLGVSQGGSSSYAGTARPTATAALGSGYKRVNSTTGNPGGKQKSTGISMFGQLQQSLKTIIDILTDMNNKLGNLTGSKGKTFGSIRGQNSKQSRQQGGGILDMLKGLIPVLAMVAAGLAAGPLGQGAMSAARKAFETGGQNLRNAGEKAGKGVRDLISNTGKNAGKAFNNIAKGLGINKTDIGAKIRGSMSGVARSAQGGIKALGEKFGANFDKTGKQMQTAGRIAAGIDVGYHGIQSVAGYVTGDMDKGNSEATKAGKDLLEYKAVSSLGKSGINKGVRSGMFGVSAVLEEVDLHNDINSINNNKSMSAEDKERAIAQRTTRARASEAESLAIGGVSLLKAGMKRNVIGGTAIAGIELARAAQDNYNIDHDQHMNTQQRKKAHEDLNHNTWKKGFGALGGVLGGIGGGALGTLVAPGFGTVAGGIGGGIGGNYLGEMVGEKAEHAVGGAVDWAKGIGKSFMDSPVGKGVAGVAPGIGMIAGALASGPAGMAASVPAMVVNFTNNNAVYKDVASIKDVEQKIKDIFIKQAAQAPSPTYGQGAASNGSGGGLLASAEHFFGGFNGG